MSSKVMVVNAGSSSIKWMIMEKANLEVISKGLAERINVDGALEMSFGGQKFTSNLPLPSHLEAVNQIMAMSLEHKVISNVEEVEIIGFRVVHGATHFSKATILNADSIAKIEDAASYAPLHNPPALVAIKAFEKLFPKSKKVAIFDTAFHTTMPEVSYTYPIDKNFTEKLGVRKYGMHGTSHHFIALKAAEIFKKDKVNVVVLHIGNGSSLCAVKDGKSFDTSMGFTPLAGVMMGTRSGDIDPSIHEYVLNKTGMNIKEFTESLNKKSGLLGVSQISSDLRDVIAKSKEGHPDAILAVDLYAQRLIDVCAAYINKVHPCEAIIFTAGVGENSAFMREKVVKGLAGFGIKLDQTANESKIGDWAQISTSDSQIKVLVVRTDEEYMIAKEAKEIFA